MSIRLAILIMAIVLASSQSTAFGTIKTGKVTPITTFSGNQTYSNYSYTIAHTMFSTPTATLALISFDSLLSSIFAFNTTILTTNGSSVVFNVQTYSSTYFNILSFHYLIESHPTLETSNVCYYTSSLYTGSGIRSSTFSNVTTGLTGNYLLVSTVLTGFKAHNTEGTTMILGASSTISNGTISVYVEVRDHTLLEWICVGLIVYNPRSTLVGEFYLYRVGTVTSSGIVGLPNNAAYRKANVMFFGISAVNLGTTADQSIFIMHSNNVATPLASPTINDNIVGLYLQQLFIWTDPCTSTATNYVPLPGIGNTTCVATCPGLEYNDTNQYCCTCGMQTGNCLTCDSTQCLTCDGASPTFRTLKTGVSPRICVCMSGYFELSGTCTLCRTRITNCLTCSNAITCTSCITGFVPSGGICVCAAGTYLTNGICIPLKGCLLWYNITNAYYCTNCDGSNYFYMLANQTCACMANTVYNSITGMCEGSCSDGKALGNICDLGARNGVPGSGCLANCTV